MTSRRQKGSLMRMAPGVIRDAIISHLEGCGDHGSRLTEITEAVVERLGSSVSSSSVRSYLNLNTPNVFERVSRGTYRLRKNSRV